MTKKKLTKAEIRKKNAKKRKIKRKIKKVEKQAYKTGKKVLRKAKVGMTRTDLISEIRKLEAKQSKTVKAISQFAKGKGKVAELILGGTNVWNMFIMLYQWDLPKGWHAVKKGVSKMKKADLEAYYDQLLSIEFMSNHTAQEMEKFIKKEIHDLKKLANESGLDIEDLMKVDWEQWVGLYEIPSEYLNEARWLSPAEKISTLVGILKEQENVSPRQREEEYASDNIFSIADWEYVANHAKIVSGGLY